MKTKTTTAILAICICFMCICAQAGNPGNGAATGKTAAPDSTKVTRLQELVVKSKTAWIEGDKAVFIPQKSDRNLSNDAASLLRRMQIPLLNVEGGNIRNVRGQEVTVFINGVRAESTDLATFWPKDALRVEYMDNPSDPRYEGVECAVNFVMRRYEAGGVARVNAYQQVRNRGRYRAASKVEYRRMTFGMTADAGYGRDYTASATGSETYEDILYGGKTYDIVNKAFSEKYVTRSDNAGATFNARYNDGDNIITHTASLLWNNNPGSSTDASLSWSPALFPAGKSVSRTSGHSLSPQLSAFYNIRLTDKWRFYARWGYAHFHNDAAYSYAQDAADPIDNVTEENVDYARGFAQIFWRPNRKISSYFEVNTYMNWYDTRYTGSTQTVSRQRRGETYANLNLYWAVSDRLQVSLRPGLTAAYWKSGDNRQETHITPRAQLNVNWSPTSKFYASGDVSYFRSYPSASASSDVTVRQTGLIWATGNPSLKGSDKWWLSTGQTWMPLDWLKFNNSLWWISERNEVFSFYEKAPAGMEGLVRREMNGPSIDKLQWDFTTTVSLFGGRWRISLHPVVKHTRAHGDFSRSMMAFRMRGGTDLTLGNFEVFVGYGGKEKFLDEAGSKLYRTTEDWSASLSYGNGDLYVNLALEDIFHRRRKETVLTQAGAFRSYRENLMNARYLCLTLTYTVGFGKKVKRNIDIDNPLGIETGVIEM